MINSKQTRTQPQADNRRSKSKFSIWVAIVVGVIAAAGSASAHPAAQTTAPNVTTAGATSYSFTVKWTSDAGMDPATLDNGDFRVTGPGGFNAPVALVSLSGSYTVMATYAFLPPGGSWDSADNGTYDIVLQANQVYDTLGNVGAPGKTASFSVAVPGPPAPVPAQLLNVSTRLRVQTGEGAMIGGFIITGNVAKKVIVRAIGPSLTAAGISGVLANPTIELNGSGGKITSNDDWKNSQQADIQATGVAPTNELESAIIATLAPGNYTAVVGGKNQTTGVGLVEVYDLDQPAASKLANISTRGAVETGSNVMIGGFILGNKTGSATVIVRALGPSLTSAGITAVLADPTLELRDGNGGLIRSNNNWKDSQQTEIAATGIPPKNDSESAIVATLAPGPYTAIVAGANGGVGVGLVELYQLQ